MPTRRHMMLTESVTDIILYLWMFANTAILTVEGQYMAVSVTMIVVGSFCLAKRSDY